MGKRADSDESYILNLCDEILGVKAVRQKRFDFLRGDPRLMQEDWPETYTMLYLQVLVEMHRDMFWRMQEKE